MNTIDILQNLQPYSDFLEELKKEELPTLQEDKGFERLKKSINIQYAFITLRLYVVTKSSNVNKELDQRLLCEIRFEITNDKIVFKEVFHENTMRKTTLTQTIPNDKTVSGIQWKANPEDKTFCKEYLNYLTAADEIAAQGMNCASGDNYRPGFYSEIKITEEGITLNQINRMNSKSLDHKDNYSMRDLEMFIPFHKSTEPVSYNFITIGEMRIAFSDHSSKNLKSCGEAILARIKEVKEVWRE